MPVLSVMTSNAVAAIVLVIVLVVPVAAGFVGGIKWSWLKATIIMLWATGILHFVTVAAISLWVADCPDCPVGHFDVDAAGDRADQTHVQVILLTVAAIYWAMASTLSAAVGRAVARRASRHG